MKILIVCMFVFLATRTSFATTLKFQGCSEDQIETVMFVFEKTQPFVEAGLREAVGHPYRGSFSLAEIDQVLNKADTGIFVKCKDTPRDPKTVASSKSRDLFNKQEKVILFPAFFDERVHSPEARRFASPEYTMCERGRFFWQVFFDAELDYKPPVRRSSGKYVKVHDASWLAATTIGSSCRSYYE